MKNTRDLEKILRSIQENMNPFGEEVNKDFLFNIGTGKSSKQDTAEFLLNVNKIGQKACEAFIIQCIKDPKRFEERIPRHKILNFANEVVSYSLRGANNQPMAVEMVRDIFGSILFLALQRKIDRSRRFCHFHLHLHHHRLVMLMELYSKHKKVY